MFCSSPVRPSDRPVPAHSEEIPDRRDEGAGQEHGRHHRGLGEDGQRLYPVHQGAERRAGDLPPSGLPGGKLKDSVLKYSCMAQSNFDTELHSELFVALVLRKGKCVLCFK